MKRIVLGIVCSLCISLLYAQSPVNETKSYVFPQKVTPQGFDNYLFYTCYFNDNIMYNMRNYEFGETKDSIVTFKINPAGSSLAVIYKNKDKRQVSILDLDIKDNVIHKFKDVDSATAVAYSHDAKMILIATPTEVQFYETRKYTLVDRMPMPFAVTKLLISSNGYFMAAAGDNKVTVWNFEQKRVRKEYNFNVKVNDICFSGDNNSFATLTNDGMLATYSTQDFALSQTIDLQKTASRCAFHPDGKYILAINNDSQIIVINLMDLIDRSYIDSDRGGLKDLKFVVDQNNKRYYLAYNTASSLNYEDLSRLAPHYTKLLSDELNMKMNDWMKMMPNESLEDYNLRVNDETRMEQMQLFEQEIATRLAGDMLSMEEITLGNYNPESNILELSFSSMPTIYLNVPTEEVNDFDNSDNLEFRNVRYGLTENDKFEMIYADVYNKVSGKTYNFNNLKRQKLDYMKSDDNFVSLELIQQSNMEQLKLEEIKEEVINLAKQENTITDHTNISVNADIVQAKDADGKNIMNYKVDFTYQVEDGFSVYEDFAPGKYKIDESGAAKAMLAIIKKALEKDFAQYIKDGKKVKVNIYGMADGMAINRKIPYDGSFGEFENEPMYKNGFLSNITVTKASGITKNEQLAYMRTMAVRDHIVKNITELGKMNTEYTHNIELATGKGGQFRRIHVEFIFIDAF